DGLASGDLVFRMSGQHPSKRAFTRAVWSHDRVHLAGVDRQVDASKDLASGNARPQTFDAEHHPTLPSRLTLRSFCASTANSIGSCLKTSLQKPLTIMLTASSVESPR